MPRNCAITVEQAIEVIIKYSHYFKTNIPDYSNKVWNEMSSSHNGLWNKKSWYTNVQYNRRNILSIARERMGVGTNCDHQQFSNSQNLDGSCEELNSTSASQTSDVDTVQLEETLPGEEIFNLYLSPEEWHQIKPTSDSGSKRTSNTLQAHIWTNIIALAFWKQHKLPCAYSFKNAQVNQSSERKFFLKIKGKCRSDKCGNFFVGIGYDEPRDNTEYLIQVKTRNTTFDDHEDVRRYLNGFLREKIGEECFTEGCHNVEKKLIANSLNRGDLAQPIIPSNNALRHAKCEQVNKHLGIEDEDRMDPIKALYEMQFDNEFLGSVQDLSYSPFFVFYGTSEQISTFQKYCRTERNSSKISIDATGSLVKKLNRPKGIKTAHIFLYCIVINFHQTIQSIYQMLTESQDTDTITLWLNRFLRRANKKPKEVITDYSRALLAAVSLAFNKMSLNMYVEECFQMVMNRKTFISNIVTYVRVDVAHLINLACRWKCWKRIQQSLVRDFFLRCLSLLVDCETVEDFEYILQLTFIIAYQPFIDTTVKINEQKMTVRNVFKKLQSIVACRKINVKNTENSIMQDTMVDDEEINDNEAPSSSINNYLNTIVENAKTIIKEGEEINGFYCPEYAKNLFRICQEFPLWTGVTIPYITNHASSSSSEANFGDLKNLVLKNYKKNLRIDKFVKIHLRDLIGGTRKFDSNLSNFIQKRCRPPSPELKQIRKKIKKEENTKSLSFNEQENWRNKANPYLFHNNYNDEQDNEEYQQSTSNDDDNDDDESSQNKIEKKDNSIEESEKLEWNRDTDNDDRNMQYKIEEENDDSREDKKLEWNDNIDDDDNYNKPKVQKRNNDNEKSVQLEWNDDSNGQYKKFEVKQDLNEKTQSEQPNFKNDNDKENHKIRWNNNDDKNHCQRQELITRKNPSKYFSHYPEIRLYDSSLPPKIIEKNIFLVNGGLCKGVKIEKSKFLIFARNTCPFDSIVSILATSAIDNPQYFGTIEENVNNLDIFDFIKSLIISGVGAFIERRRVTLLYNFYNNTLKTKTIGDITVSESIDCWDSARNVWVHLFRSQPSAIITMCCNNCKENKSKGYTPKIYEYQTISPNHNIVLSKGFSNISSVINFKRPTITCSCGQMMEQELVINDQVYIELDIRRRDIFDNMTQHGERCKMRDIPRMLCLENRSYRLAGIVAYISGHFVAYCWRYNNCWELYNDLLKRKQFSRESTEIEPHGLIYIHF